MPTPDSSPTQALVPSQETTVTPAANSQAELEQQKPETTAEEQPLDTIESKPQEPAATKLLENSWLRVPLQPDIKSPTDSLEPIGLINRIKGAIARSAGR